MAVNRTKVQFLYGIGDNLVQMPPPPIVATRAPGTRDLAQLGTIWVDEPSSAVFFLSSITANSANWVGTSTGSGTFASVTVNPGNLTVTAGNIAITLGDLAVGGNSNLTGNLTVGGTTTLNGDIDITSALLIDLTSTLDAAPSILLEANGGVSEQVRLFSNQGTAVNSIYLLSDVGGITLEATGLASDDAINLIATGGGIDMDAALQINIASSENASDSIVITSSAGGIDILAPGGAAGEDIDIDANASVNIDGAEAIASAITITASNAVGGITLDAGTGGIEIGNTATCTPIDIGDFAPTASRTINIGGGTVVTAAVTDLVDIAPDGATTNANSVKQVDIATGVLTTGQSLVNINTGTAASGTHTTSISSGTGGGTKAVNIGNADGLTTFNLDAITLINDSINVNTSINTGTSTGVIGIGNALAGAITLDTAAGVSIDAAAASNFTVAGAGIDLTLDSGAGRVIIDGGEAGANAVTIDASDAGGGIDCDSGTLGTILDSTGAISLDAAAASNFTVTGAGIDLTLDSASGRVIVNAEEAAANAITLLSAAGGLDANVALSMNLDSSEAAATAIVINASNAGGGIDCDSGTTGTILDSTGAISLDAAAASNFTVTGAGIDLTLDSAAGRVVVNAEEAIASAITLLSAAGGLDVDVALQMNLDSSQAAATAIVINSSNAGGGIDCDSGTGGTAIDSTGAISLDSAAASNFTATGAFDVTLSSTAGSMIVDGGEAVASAVQITASDAAGGIELVSGTGGIDFAAAGAVSMTPATASVAGAALTINANVGVATFTGQTTGAGVQATFTITNSTVAATSGIFVTVTNVGGNDARMTMERVFPAAGSFEVMTQNNGAAALNGDVLINFWRFA